MLPCRIPITLLGCGSSRRVSLPAKNCSGTAGTRASHSRMPTSSSAHSWVPLQMSLRHQKISRAAWAAIMVVLWLASLPNPSLEPLQASSGLQQVVQRSFRGQICEAILCWSCRPGIYPTAARGRHRMLHFDPARRISLRCEEFLETGLHLVPGSTGLLASELACIFSRTCPWTSLPAMTILVPWVFTAG